jgi:hypothetical protein
MQYKKEMFLPLDYVRSGQEYIGYSFGSTEEPHVDLLWLDNIYENYNEIEDKFFLDYWFEFLNAYGGNYTRPDYEHGLERGGWEVRYPI